MTGMPLSRTLSMAGAAASLLLLPSCEGILGGVYDTPPSGAAQATARGQLYIDASDWTQWHYIDLPELARMAEEDPGCNPSSAWVSLPVATPDAQSEPAAERAPGHEPGIYTYWYDVYGAGLSRREFRSFQPSAPQEEPERWSIAVHRNNVRTNGGAAAATPYSSLSEIPEGREWLSSLDFRPDEWNETYVWTVQDRMLSGIIGNQGIEVNQTLSSWLRIEIPPMPPAFSLNSKVFVVRLADGSMAAVQLQDYQSPTGTKCCLTINYRYPL